MGWGWWLSLALFPLLNFLGFGLLLIFGRFSGARHGDFGAGQKHEPGFLFLAFVRKKTDNSVLLFGQMFTHLKGAGEERLQSVKMILFPVLHQRMIVALRARNVHSKKCHAHIIGQAIKIPNFRLEVGARTFGGRIRLIGNHQFAEDPVPTTLLANSTVQIRQQ